jgi:hypothetical protein
VKKELGGPASYTIKRKYRMSKPKSEPIIVVTTIIGVIIAAIALIPAFGQWLAPRAPALDSPTNSPTVTITSDPTLYDNFNDPSFEGTFNGRKWTKNTSTGCDIIQSEGALLFESTEATSSYRECALTINHPATVKSNQLGTVEARIQLASFGLSDGGAGQGIQLTTSDLPGGSWWAWCGTKATKNKGIFHEFEIMNWGTRKQVDTSSISPTDKQWHTIHLEANPDTLQITCMVDGNLLGSAIPNDVAALKGAQFSRSLQTWYDLVVRQG